MTKAERTRQLIIEKSAPIFNTKGIAATAMSDIMEATGLAKGSLYVHFENKEELSCAAVDYNLDSLARKIFSSVNKYHTAKAKLFAFIDFLSDPLHPPVIGGCPMINFGMEADDTNPLISQKVNHMVQTSMHNITAIIEGGIANGEFKKKWNAGEFAVKMFAMIEGGIMMCRVSGSNAQMKTIVKILKKEIDKKSS